MDQLDQQQYRLNVRVEEVSIYRKEKRIDFVVL
jgi:hypothetical protein